ncbi:MULTISPECIES: prepilin peptidase [unclassified Ensifer]|uniref:A24 family peptidase n=1 Tax=unclassified Ensifer TaxID=2633371 RepID=UPI0008135087|nr:MULTISPECIES: prepilin peptidase [unclassified Ensifer]OCO98797.1 peptidase [Ensifer sp. LC14]OCP13276.1 peptidase [Ensifer sp. LC13]OCP13877.1 peptidase [Ensifer sp. LC11]OCP28258.1 peptidase [Ensifer sp. LC499]
MIEAAIFVIFPFCLGFAAFSDLLTMTIPNRASAILVGSFFVVAPLAGLGFSEIGLHLAATLAVFAACFCLFATNVMGGGDAKLLTASAIWFGFTPSLMAFLIYVSIFGGVLTLAILLLRRQENVILATGIPVPHLLLTAKKVPYGIAIALGGFAAYPSSPLVEAAFARLS